MAAVEKNQPATIQIANNPIREASKSRSTVLNPISQFLAHSSSFDTFLILKASTQKERLSCSCTNVLLCCIIQCRFFVLHMERGLQLVGVWSEHPFHKNNTMKISSEESGCISRKFCTSENFPLRGKLPCIT